MGDSTTAAKILASEGPSEAKRLGRKVKNFDQKLWDRECDKVVEEGNFLKFTQDKKCKKALLGTGDKILVEASPNDRIWGIGFAPEDDPESKEEQWGSNKLGVALMAVRGRLRNDIQGK